MAASAAAFAIGGRLLPKPAEFGFATFVMTLFGAGSLAGGVGVEVLGHWLSGLHPTTNSYSAMVYMADALTGQLAFAVLLMAAFTMARQVVGKLDSERRGCFENTALLAYYTSAQGLFGLLLIHGFPRIIG
jgi:cytochrome c oxidase subunit I+III